MGEGPSRRKAAILSAATVGLGAGVALERLLIGRARVKRDPFKEEPYGHLLPDRTYSVESFDGTKLAVDEMGPPESRRGAIFLHGLALDSRIWHHQWSGLGWQGRLIFFDARGHGRSVGEDDEVTLEVLSRDLAAVIEASGLEEIVLVGHSMGGMTALEHTRQFSSEFGGRVKALVLANTTHTDAIKTMAGSGFIGPVEARIRSLIDLLLTDPRSARVMRLRSDDLSYLLVRLTGFGQDASPSQVEFVGSLLAAFPGSSLGVFLRALHGFHMGEELNSIAVPTLVLAGRRDRLTTSKASEYIANAIEGSEMVVFEDAGHVAMLERCFDFNLVLDSFLERVLPVGRSKRAASRS